MTLTQTWFPQALPLRLDETGTVRIGNSRVTLETIIAYYRQGMTAEELADAFDTVSLAEMHTVIGYYLRNHEVVDKYLADEANTAQKLRTEIEARQGPGITREILLQRRAQRQRGAE